MQTIRLKFLLPLYLYFSWLAETDFFRSQGLDAFYPHCTFICPSFLPGDVSLPPAPTWTQGFKFLFITDVLIINLW